MAKETFVHIVYIPFSGVGIGDAFRDSDWLKYRIQIFIDFTLQSIKNQSRKGSLLWLSFRPEDEYDFALNDLWVALQEAEIPYVSTFNGLMYWDDKFSNKPIEVIKNVLRIARGCWRTGRWSVLFPSIFNIVKNKNRTLPERLEASLEKLHVYLHDVDWVYMTRLDSDDLVHKDLFHKIMQSPRKPNRAYVLKNGYVYDKATQQLAQYNPKTNPPFHTIVFPGEVFFNAGFHLRYYGSFKSHEDVPRVFDAAEFDQEDRLYCVVIHSREHQISTIWNHPFKGDIVSEPEKILKQFGL